jgi:hypothetical protein
MKVALRHASRKFAPRSASRRDAGNAEKDLAMNYRRGATSFERIANYAAEFEICGRGKKVTPQLFWL